MLYIVSMAVTKQPGSEAAIWGSLGRTPRRWYFFPNFHRVSLCNLASVMHGMQQCSSVRPDSWLINPGFPSPPFPPPHWNNQT